MKAALNLLCLIVVMVASAGLMRGRLGPDAEPIRCDGDVCPVCGEEFMCSKPILLHQNCGHNFCLCTECKGSYKLNLDWEGLRRSGNSVWDPMKREWHVPGERRSLLEKARRLLHMEE